MISWQFEVLPRFADNNSSKSYPTGTVPCLQVRSLLNIVRMKCPCPPRNSSLNKRRLPGMTVEKSLQEDPLHLSKRAAASPSFSFSRSSERARRNHLLSNNTRNVEDQVLHLDFSLLVGNLQACSRPQYKNHISFRRLLQKESIAGREFRVRTYGRISMEEESTNF